MFQGKRSHRQAKISYKRIWKEKNEEDVGQDKEVHIETTSISPLDPVLAKQRMNFVKGLFCHNVLSIMQAA